MALGKRTKRLFFKEVPAQVKRFRTSREISSSLFRFFFSISADTYLNVIKSNLSRLYFESLRVILKKITQSLNCPAKFHFHHSFLLNSQTLYVHYNL